MGRLPRRHGRPRRWLGGAAPRGLLLPYMACCPCCRPPLMVLETAYVTVHGRERAVLRPDGVVRATALLCAVWRACCGGRSVPSSPLSYGAR